MKALLLREQFQQLARARANSLSSTSSFSSDTSLVSSAPNFQYLLYKYIIVLEHVWWLDIRGRINTAMLSQSTSYTGYLVYKLSKEGYCGLESASAIQRFVNDEFDGESEKRAQVAHLELGLYDKGNIPVKRVDGWMEVKLGEFNVDGGNDKEVDVRLLSTTTLKWGLIVEGIEFRPHGVIGVHHLVFSIQPTHGKQKEEKRSSRVKQIFNIKLIFT